MIMDCIMSVLMNLGLSNYFLEPLRYFSEFHIISEGTGNLLTYCISQLTHGSYYCH
jgi:hypothetical protein